MKRLIAKFLILTTISLNNVSIYASDNIYTNNVKGIYYGTKEAKEIINNIKFNDVAPNYWAKEAIVKAGALNMVKGYNKNIYNPNGKVSNQEALAFLLRVANLEQEAQEIGNSIKDTGFGDSVLQVWSLGYLNLANRIGLINNQEYASAIQKDDVQIQDGSFDRNAPVTREQVATWLVKVLNYISSEPLQVENQQYIYQFNDWKNISSEHINNVEICVSNGIMKGSNNRFNPKGSLTRAEMAQILSNMDSLYNNSVGLEKKNGTIVKIEDEQINEANNSTLNRNIYIRTSDGNIDLIKYVMTNNSSPQAYNQDVVVLNNGAVTGLSSLREDNEIEYLVKLEDSSVKFINVINSNLKQEKVFGVLKSIDYSNGQVQIEDNRGKLYSYYTIDGLTGTVDNNNFAYVDGVKKVGNNIPIGSYINIYLNNDIASKIEYVGGYNLSSEINGVVIENNVDLSYITIIDSNGREITKNYYEDDVIVEKQNHYDVEDEIGYIDDMFPNFNYNDDKDTTIEQIEVGDIVFLTTSEEDNDVIKKINSVTNYSIKYGKVKQISNDGLLSQVLIEYENGETSWFEFSNNIFISKSGAPTNISNLKEGDWIKLLVNEAVVAAGNTIETVKEIVIEEQGHTVVDLVKGSVSSINSVQNKISVKNAYTLTKEGWSNYKDILQLSIDSSFTQYYYEDKKVSLDYFNRYLKRGDGEVYIALEDNYSGNVVSKITYRSGRDELLDSSFIVNSNSTGEFNTENYLSNIKIDEGTIIRKDGKVVSQNSVKSSDYARVSLNGLGKAAIVDIYEKPSVSGVLIARGRVSKIEENKSFVVSSISQLIGNSWTYSPVERQFSIDNTTLFITKDGIKKIDDFIGYTDKSSLGKTFTIVYDGTKATHIIEAPYATKIVSGTVYSVSNNKVGLKDGQYINSKGIWESVSNINTEIGVNTEINTIVIKNNKILDINDLEKGDKVRVFTESLPNEIKGGMQISGRIIFVD